MRWGEGTPFQPSRPAPSPLAGEGWGEGEYPIKTLVTLNRPLVNAMLAEAAHREGLEFVLLELEDLRAAAHLCVTLSETSMKHYGIPSIAEAAALAGAGASARTGAGCGSTGWAACTPLMRLITTHLYP